MSEPLITCVIPTYRRPKLLRRALNSVLNQTFPSFRVAVFDNASGDDTAEVVRAIAAHDLRVSYHCHAENIGAAANFAFALRDVRTPYFCVLGDDDALLPEFFAAAVAALESHPEAAFYCGRTITDDRLNGVLRHGQGGWSEGVHQPSRETVARMISQHFISTGVLFRREVQEIVGPFASFASDKSYVIVASASRPLYADSREQAVFTLHPMSFSAGIATADRAPHDAAFAMQILHETLAGLERTPFARDPVIREHLLANTRREVLSSLLLKSVPNRRWRAVTPLLQSSALGFGPVQRAALWALRAIGSVPLIERAFAAVARVGGAAIGRTLARTARQREDAAVRAYLESGCDSPEVLTRGADR